MNHIHNWNELENYKEPMFATTWSEFVNLSWKGKIFTITIYLAIFLIVITVIMIIKMSKTEKTYSKKKYKKVIVKGLLWDHVEYHERENYLK